MSLVMLGLLVAEYPVDVLIQLLPHYYPTFALVIVIGRKTSKLLTRTCFNVSCIIIFRDAVSPCANILSIFILQICCHSHTKNVLKWLPLILILLANDIEVNPGPYEKDCFTFMNWNLNSLREIVSEST